MTAEEFVATVGEGPLALGNVRVAVEAFFDEIDRAGSDQRFLYGELVESIRAVGGSLTPAERTWLRGVLEGRADGRFTDETTAIRQLLDAKSPDGERPPMAGSVNALVVSDAPFRGRRFGAVQTLRLRHTRTDRGALLDERAAGDAVFRSFRAGVMAGEAFVMRQAFGDRPFAPVLTAGDTFEGFFPDLPVDIRRIAGPSLGIGAAVATISLLLDLPVPGDIAFTGGIDDRGGVDQVGWLEEKIAAAADKGLRAICARDDGGFAARYGIQVWPATDVSAVVARIFNGAELAEGIARLRQRAGPAVSGAVRSDVVDEDDLASRRVLITWVSDADPVGIPRGQKSYEEGAILAACRVVRPTAVHILHTVDRFAEKARLVKQVLEDGEGIERVKLHALNEIEDPTDYRQLIPTVTRIVRGAMADEAGTRYFVNLSSGTSQAETAWHVLDIWDWLCGAKLLQVREGRHVKEGESKVRRVDLGGIKVRAES